MNGGAIQQRREREDDESLDSLNLSCLWDVEAKILSKQQPDVKLGREVRNWRLRHKKDEIKRT